jgi:pilus assembly protein Flp/PilA
MVLLQRFGDDRRAATLVEYALIAALVSVAAVASLRLLGTGLSSTYSTVQTQVSNAAAGMP